MRQLIKGPIPPILQANAVKWHAELKDILDRGEKPSEAIKGRYRHAQVKSSLIDETHGKCAYCESKLRHVTHGDVEHIAPKSKVPSKAYEWSNLTLACDICNENKGDYYSDDPNVSQDNLIDPYIDDPTQHFLFMREVVSPRPDSLRAVATENLIKLSRNELLERRRERMKFLDGMVRAYAQASAEYKQMLLDDLINNHLKDDDEYSAVSRAYVDYLRGLGIVV